jgi:RNA polymerase sigma factor (sigma-70 family)
MDGSPSTANRSLAELVARARTGEAPAWSALVDRYTNLLWSIARGMRLSSADAGDVVQTTWLRLVEHLDKIHDPERIGGWLATTARNEGLLLVRNRARMQVGFAEDVADQVDDASVGGWAGGTGSGAPPAPDADLLRRERDGELRRAFARLGARCRTLLGLLVTEPRPSYEEVAAALGLAVGGIGPTRARCLRELRSLLADAAGDGPDDPAAAASRRPEQAR